VKKSCLALIAAAVFASGSALAHHSFAEFQPNKIEVIKGTLLKFDHLNPHSWISVVGVVDQKGPSGRWDIIGDAPLELAKIGINAGTLKPGDKVTVAFHPLRDGRQGGSFVFVVTQDGTVLGAKPSNFGLDVATLKP
jgi:hypothetical protein